MSPEQRQRDAQRMDSVGQLTGGLAHDFNNLLTVMQGNLQALQELPTVRDDPAAVPLLNAALRAAQRGAELTRSLLAFSRRQQLAPTSVDAVAMLRDLLAMLRRTMDQRIRLELNAAALCPECIADPALLESALMNIALNARDAMPDGGTLRCEVSPCDELPESLHAELEHAADGYVAIALHDTGIGMTSEVHARAFEPFFTTKEAGRGTGLGLSSTYGFVKQSSGAIAIESEPGRGTCVTLYLPRERRVVPRAAPVRSGSVGTLRALDVMLVEDDLEVMAVSLSFLRLLGCEVRAYSSGEHALFALEREAPPALLISDVALGEGMRGTLLARKVRARWPHVAVLLMSGFLPKTEEFATMVSSIELLAKPFSREQLGEAMLRALAEPRLHGAGAAPVDVGTPSVK